MKQTYSLLKHEALGMVKAKNLACAEKALLHEHEVNQVFETP